MYIFCLQQQPTSHNKDSCQKSLSTGSNQNTFPIFVLSSLESYIDLDTKFLDQADHTNDQDLDNHHCPVNRLDTQSKKCVFILTFSKIYFLKENPLDVFFIL